MINNKVPNWMKTVREPYIMSARELQITLQYYTISNINHRESILMQLLKIEEIHKIWDIQDYLRNEGYLCISNYVLEITEKGRNKLKKLDRKLGHILLLNID